MTRLALDVLEEPGPVVSDGVSPPIRLAQRRLFLWVRLGGEYALRQAVLDTGAPFTFVPWKIWPALDRRGAITWVAHGPTLTPRDRLPVLVVAGARYRFRLGWIDLQVARLDGSALGAVPVLAQFLEDQRLAPTDPPPLPARPVLGLGGGLLHGRQLVVEADANGQKWAAALIEP